MSHSVIHICYGIPLSLTTSGENSGKTQEMQELFESGIDGFFSHYSSKAIESSPSGFGVEIMTCYPDDHHVELQDCVSQEVLERYGTLYNKLDKEVQKQLEMFGKARLFILWATD